MRRWRRKYLYYDLGDCLDMIFVIKMMDYDCLGGIYGIKMMGYDFFGWLR